MLPIDELLGIIDILLGCLLMVFCFVIKPARKFILLNAFVLSCTMIATAMLSGGAMDWLLSIALILATAAGILLFTKD